MAIRDPASTPPYTELIPGRLYAVGGTYPLDGQVSWAPSTGAQHPTQAYILRRNDQTIVIDPGLKHIGRQVLTGTQAILPAGSALTVLVTRPQFDCVGNIGALFEAYPSMLICTHMPPNYFDCFDDLLAATDNGNARSTVLARPQTAGLRVIEPAVHTLRTIWAYDEITKTLFTSDSFTHGTVTEPTARPVITNGVHDVSTVDDVAEHLFATHHWMRGAPLDVIADDVQQIYRNFDINIVAPGRGCVLQGRDVVTRHFGLMIDALRSANTRAAA